MSKTIHLTDLEYEVIHHALNNLPLDWKVFQGCNYQNSMDLLVDSFPNDPKMTEEQLDAVVTKLCMETFEL